MNLLDIVIIAIVLLALVRGLFKGLVRELLSLGAVVLGIFLASRFNGLLSPLLEQYLSGPTTATAASYLVIFLGTLILCWLIGRIFQQLAEDSLAGWVDTILGGALGACEGLLACLVLVLMLATFLSGADFYRQSALAPRLLPAAAWIGGSLPDAITEAVKQAGNALPAPEVDDEDE